MEETLVLNVGGTRHETFRATLQRLPLSRLARLTFEDPSYNNATKEFFFDRNPNIFTHLLDFYRTGELHFPHCICGPAIKTELKFWQIDEDKICACCWKSYREFEEEKATMEVIEKAFEEQTEDINNIFHGTRNWRDKMWDFLENPRSSKSAKVRLVLIEKK